MTHGAYTSSRWATLRRWWATQLPTTCPRCGQPVTSDQRWDLGHTIPVLQDPSRALDATNTRPEHQACNRAAGARTTNQQRRRETRTPGW